MDKLIEKFKNPDPEYRSAPFWSWNDKLDIKELKRQLDEMKSGGMIGGFIHSRVGLITPYLSKEWFECVKECVSYAKQLGIPIYLYDEDRWPSGFAGGLIKNSKKYSMKLLKIKKIGKHKIKYEIIDLPPSAWFNNTGYLDTCNKDAVKLFLDSTYELYKNTVGNEFNKTILGIFTDEPSYFSHGYAQRDKKHIYRPWTKNFDKLFHKRYGYDIKENIISLIENEGDYIKIRYDYYRLLHELFLVNYGKQIYEWCQQNNIPFTGHYLEEDTLASQTNLIGAAMPFYEYMHKPGIDHLCRVIDPVYLTIKQCSSVAHQLNKPRVLSELFGCSGQNMTFLDRKWIGNWNTVLGINLYCPHLWLYSMAGERKRDYPPTLSYQQPYWKYNKIIEDYFARINYITNQGKFCANITVLHPIESAWCMYNPTDLNFVYKLNDIFITLLKTLSGQHYDFDLCDESLLEKYGSITDNLIQICNMKYKLFIIPPVVTLRKKTVELLTKFADSGGKIIAFGNIPERIEGEKTKDNTLNSLWSKIIVVNTTENIKNKIIELIPKLIPRDISITDNNGNEVEDIYYHHRKIDNIDIYFLVNINKYKEYDVKVKIPFNGTQNFILENWLPETGEITKLNTTIEEQNIVIDLHFYEASSYVIVKRTGQVSSNYSNKTNLNKSELKQIFKFDNNNWIFKPENLNCMTLDYCQYKIGNSKIWSEPLYCLDIQNLFIQKFKNGTKFYLRYNFKTDFSKKPERMFLVIEHPENYKININGITVSNKDIGYWIDSYFRKIEITDYIKLKGKNYIELQSKFMLPIKPKTLIYVGNGTEIESIYLVGNFSVSGNFKHKFTPENKFKKLNVGWLISDIKSDTDTGLIGKNFIISDQKLPQPKDIVSTGYPFYVGSFVFNQEFNLNKDINKNEKIYLCCDKLNSIILKVKLNERIAGIIVWPPYILDITNYLNNGKNIIEIEIANSLRNLLGPHHLKVINPEGVGPESFINKKNWVNYYTFVNFGLPELNLCVRKER